MLSRKHTRNKIIFWGLAYWVLLTLSYSWTLQNHWSDSWPLEWNLLKFIIASITIFMMLKLIPNDDSILSLFITIVLYIVVIPIAVVYVCQNRETTYYISVAICFMVVETFVRHIRPHDTSIIMGGVDVNKCVIFFSMVLLIMSVFLMYRERGVPDLNSLDFSITYEIRSSYELSGISSSLFHMSTKAIIPFLIAVFILKKNYKFVCFLFATQLLFFLWLANKTTLFSIGVLIIGYYIAKAPNGVVLFSKLMFIGVFVISVFEGLNGQIESGVSNTIYMIYSIVVRRTLFIPAYLKYCYYDFFVVKGQPLEGFFGTFIAPFLTRLGVENPYSILSDSRTIGMYYMNNSNANTGVFGAELAHFGYIGIVVAALLLVIFFICVKKSESVNGRLFTCCIGIYTVFSLADSGSIAMIDYSPMLFIALIMYFFNINKYVTSFNNIRENKHL